MITQKLRKVVNRYVVTIPKEEVERQQLVARQLLIIEIQPAEGRPVLLPQYVTPLTGVGTSTKTSTDTWPIAKP